MVSRIGALLKAGWSEVVVVTDHGWLLVPGGLPKVELKSFLAEHRWGRCATLKSGAQTNALTSNGDGIRKSRLPARQVLAASAPPWSIPTAEYRSKKW